MGLYFPVELVVSLMNVKSGFHRIKGVGGGIPILEYDH